MIDTQAERKPVVRCTQCDREVDHYNTHMSGSNELNNVCWECTSRAEKGFNAKRGFHRESRGGIIRR
ncbi:MAG TPA: hypothetical protein VGO43_10980 [Pyrinomonadaceae bacterium]|nr:hypothetical protein [Pyrinomonadaceae bacterium]